VLDAAARRLGLELTEGEGTTAPLEGAVVGLGAGAFDCTELYARLTRRREHRVDTLDDALAVPELEVLITTLDRIDIELFDRLATVRPGYATGLLFAAPEHLRLRCMVSALAAWGRVVDERRTQILLSPEASLGHRDIDEVRAYFASGDEIRSTYAGDSGLLIVQAHSDGIDGMISEQHTYCARIEQGAEEFAPTNRCHVLNWCHRHELALDDPGLLDHLVRPSETVAGIFIFDVCWGLIPPEGVLDVRAGIGALLAHNFSLSAIVSTWKPSFTSVDTIRDVCEDIIVGEDLGAAVGRHNAARLTQEHDHHLVVFGEPRAALCARPRPVPRVRILYDAPEVPYDHHRRLFGERRASLPTRPQLSRPLPLFHDVPEPSVEGPASPAFEKLQYFLASAWHKPGTVDRLRAVFNESAARGEVDLATSSLRGEINGQLMSALCDIVPRYERHWIARSLPTRTAVDGRHWCVGFDQPERAIPRFVMRGGPRAPNLRILTICPACGVTEMRDASLQVDVRATRDGRIELVTETEYEDLRLQFVIVSQGKRYRERSTHPWPAGEHGTFERTVALPPITYPGMVHVVAIVVADGLFSSFSFAVPGSAASNLQLLEGRASACTASLPR
jgi:hypothetical protein